MSADEDEEGYFRIISEHSANRKNFTLEIDSSRKMSWAEVLLALSDWLCDEARKMGPKDEDL